MRCFRRDQLANVVDRMAALIGARVLGRQNEIDALRPPAQLVLDPDEINLQPLRANHQPAQIADLRLRLRPARTCAEVT